MDSISDLNWYLGPHFPCTPVGGMIVQQCRDMKPYRLRLPYPVNLHPHRRDMPEKFDLSRLDELMDRLTGVVEKEQPKAKKAKQTRTRPRKKVMVNDRGYAYTYNEQGKVVGLARKTMEDYLGIRLPDHYVVGYRDGDKTNCDISNLYVGYKAGVPLDALTCTHCGARGHMVPTGLIIKDLVSNSSTESTVLQPKGETETPIRQSNEVSSRTRFTPTDSQGSSESDSRTGDSIGFSL